ncbi:MAG TPA: phosphoglucosamine mutase [Terriglobales bacterium]|nr:phosphoglucosamine mutase [Terriglobales bacterium]
MTSQKKRQLFGTDGIRGIAGEFPLTVESTYWIGRALGHDLLKANANPKVVIGQDTRESGAWITERVASGLASCGVDVDNAGVITTPGVAYLARSRGYAAGIVISASHNPWTDNGIKVFSGDGYKLPDEHELAIEQEIFALLESGTAVPPQQASRVPEEASLRREYIVWLTKSISQDLGRLRPLVDCANGAAAVEGPELFRACGVEGDFLSVSPNGRNINENCGALHPQVLARAVAAAPGRYDLGITLDGDADRVLLSDATGRIVNGDAILLMLARDLDARGQLPGALVVATTMSNMGLEVALRLSGIRLLRANVGDKYVLEEMKNTDAVLGGEQSGHIILRDGEATTGDGLLTALRVMEVMARTKRSLAELTADLKVFPQTIKNIRVKEKVPFEQIPRIKDSIQAAERELNGNGRVVVRYSGTEALARVMVEAESEDKMRSLTEKIAAAIQSSLGAN